MTIRAFIYCLILVLVSSCQDENSPKPAQPSSTQPSPDRKAPFRYLDTIYAEYGPHYINNSPQQMDTSFSMDGQRFTLRIKAEPMDKDTVCVLDQYVRRRILHQTLYYGRNHRFTFQLYSEKGRKIWEKQLTKRDYLPILGGIAAESNIELPAFKAYFAPSKQIVLTHSFWVPDSDVGAQAILYFSPTGNCSIHYHDAQGSSQGDCDVKISPDGKSLLNCRELITASGKIVEFEQEHSWIVGNLFLGKSHVLVVYEGEKEFKGATGRIYATSGQLVKEFDFLGFSGALSYTLPFAYRPEYGLYYFVDPQNERLVLIPEKNPGKILFVPFSKVRKTPSLDVHREIIEIQHEMLDFRFGIDAQGQVKAFQAREFDRDWVFFDELAP